MISSRGRFAHPGTVYPDLPYRGRFGDPRPPGVDALPLPPQPMPARRGLRPLKQWRYVAVFSPELMLCLAGVRIGPARQVFWAVWDRAARRLHERTALGRGAVELGLGRARVHDHGLRLDLQLEEARGIETVCAAGSAYGWTRKQGGVAAAGVLTLPGGPPRTFTGRAVIDDTAAYYPRHTRWRWCAGVGESRDGRPVAWNLVAGVNDPPRNSERTVWVDGEADEVPPCRFADDLSRVDDLRFEAEAVRERRENLLVVRSTYRQPFGTFSGALPGGTELGHGFGVMEFHDVRW